MPSPVSVRIDRYLIDELRRTARRWSYDRNQDVTWPEVLEAAVRQFLASEKAAKRQGA